MIVRDTAESFEAPRQSLADSTNLGRRDSAIAGIQTTGESFGSTNVRIVGDGDAVWIESGVDFAPSLVHLARLRDLRAYLARCAGLHGRAILALDCKADEDVAHIGYATRRTNFQLLPEISSLKAVQLAMRDVAPWTERRPAVVWRGPLEPMEGDLRRVFLSPKLELCLLARYSPWIDAQLTRAPPDEPLNSPLVQSMRGLGVLQAADSNAPEPAYRYTLDLEGDGEDALMLAAKWGSGCVFTIGDPWRTWLGEQLQRLRISTTVRELGSTVAAYERRGGGEQAWLAAANSIRAITDQEIGIAVEHAVRTAFAASNAV